MTATGRPWRGPLPFLGALLALYLAIPIAVLAAHLGQHAGSGLPAAGLLPALTVSLETATISTALIAVFGIPLAYRLAQGGGRTWDAVGVAIQLPLALPPLMSGILLIQLVGPYTLLGKLFGGHLTDSVAGIVIAQTFVAAPFLVVSARSAFATVDPALLELASTLGHGGFSRFRRVSLTLAAPGIGAGLLLAWLRAFGEFGATVILAYHPYSLPVFTFVQFSSTGLESTLAPTGVAVLTAAVVLVLASFTVPLLRLRRPADQPVVAAGMPPPPAPSRPSPPPLRFAVRTRAGEFELDLEHRGTSPYVALLGASGAGKSLTLRCLAGLRGLDAGAVSVGERQLGALPPERRRVGWVPQDAALLPGLDVWRQLTFGVDTDPHLAATWLERLGLRPLAGRLPGELSGGQRQRVALARALARAPDLLLLDEPFSALDRPVRDELRRELRRIQREAGITSVLVTHDPEEAALLADEIVVIGDGRVLQAGPRREVFNRPASVEVARVLGIDNLRTGRIAAARQLEADGTRIAIADDKLPAGTDVAWCVRAERVTLAPGEGATVLERFDIGLLHELTVRLDGGLELRARTADGDGLAPGTRCRVTLAPEDLTVWPASQPARACIPA